MPARLLASLAAWCLVALAAPAADVAQVAAATARPNIIVFYIDDAGPHDGRLWGASDELGHDPTLTPSIYKHFIQNGIEFTNAIAENPLCCPARGNLLTGLHSHNNGLVRNNAKQFDPSVHIGRALKKSGYATMFLGKYLNRNTSLTDAEWVRHGEGWTWLDVIYGVNGAFTNYSVQTKTGRIAYGDVHSTRMVTERAIGHLRETSVDTPVFAVLSYYNLHAPNTPMPEFTDDQRCASMPAWKPGNYNEKDVSDKPALIRDLPLVAYSNGWPMDGYCREMLGIDWSVGQVAAELAASGRLDNTLFVFTSDNGMGWGSHRWPQKKMLPYTTPVPLYMSWPDGWGRDQRVITEHTSNIDLAPTFCDLGRCTLGPFKNGSPGPDGLTLVPLVEGRSPNLGRDGLLEASFSRKASKAWTAIRTTGLHPLGLWHYVEYATGERELYDLALDPWELENQASNPDFREVQVALASRLAELRVEGVPDQSSRPDALISFDESGPYKGDDIYSAQPMEEQRKRRTGVSAGASYDYWVRLQNDGSALDSLLVRAVSSGADTMTVSYLDGATDVTAAVEGGTYSIDNLTSGSSATLVIRIAIAGEVQLGDQKASVLTVSSQSDATRVDVVKAVAVH